MRAMTTTEVRAESPTYETLHRELAAVLEGLDDPVAVMSTAACLIHQHLEAASWTGFYRVVEPGELLRVGPYQGPLGCLEIPFDRGVCDAAARSEIVVPVYDRRGTLTAVLDVDSHRPAAFGDDDRRGLERIAELLAAHL